MKAILSDSLKSKYHPFSLDKLVTTFCGGTPDKSNSNFWDGDIFWVSPKDFKGIEISKSEDKITSEGLKNSSTKLVKAESILLVVRSGILQHTLPVAVNKIEVAINQDVKALEIRDKSKLNAYYLTFYLKIFQEKLLPLIVKHGTIVQSVNTEQFDKLQIPVPPLSIQEQIVEKLESAYNSKRTKEVEAKALLDSIDTYLLDKLGGINTAPSELKHLFYRNLTEVSGNRFDATAYQLAFNFSSSKFYLEKLSKIAFIDPKVTFDKLNDESEISFVPMEVVNEKNGTIDELRFKKVAETKGFTRFQENDLLWAKITPCMQNGKSAIARNLLQGVGCGSTEFYVIRPKSNNILIDFLHILLRDKRILKTAQNFFGGSAGQQRVSSNFLKNIQIPVPPLEIQEEVTSYIQSIKERAKQLETEAAEEVAKARSEVERMILDEDQTNEIILAN